MSNATSRWIHTLCAILISWGVFVEAHAEASGYRLAIEAMKVGNWKAAISQLKPLSDRGDRCATVNLGSTYIISATNQQTTATGVELITRVATTSGVCQVKAQYTLGKYLDIQGNFQQAIPWYEVAAGENYSAAQFDLGMMHFNGDGTSQDFQKAYAFMIKAAERGHAEAQFNVALMLGQGKGVKQDLEAAHMWAAIAATNRNAKAIAAVTQGRSALPKQTITRAETRAAAFQPKKDLAR